MASKTAVFSSTGCIRLRTSGECATPDLLACDVALLASIFRKIAPAILCLAVSGCSVIPSDMPNPGSGDLAKFGGVYPVAQNRQAAVDQARQYMADWRNRQDNLEFERDVNSNFAVVSAVFAAISGVRGRVHDAKVGVTLAGGSALYNSTYQPASLGDIYGNGAAVMECFMTDLQGLSPTISDLYANDTLILQRSDLDSDPDIKDQAQAAWDKLQSLWLDINVAMSAVVNKVRTNAVAHAINVPKVSELQDKLKAALKAQDDAPIQAKAAQDAGKPKDGDDGLIAAKNTKRAMAEDQDKTVKRAVDKRTNVAQARTEAFAASAPGSAEERDAERKNLMAAEENAVKEHAAAIAELYKRREDAAIADRVAAPALARRSWSDVPESAKAYAIGLSAKLATCSP